MGMFSNFEGLSDGNEGLNVEGESLEERRKRQELEELEELTKDAHLADKMDLGGPEADKLKDFGSLHDALKKSLTAKYPHTVLRMEGKKNRAPMVGDRVILFGWQYYHGAKVVEVSTNGRILVRYDPGDGYINRWKSADEYNLM